MHTTDHTSSDSDTVNERRRDANIGSETTSDVPPRRTLTTADLASSAQRTEREAEERGAVRETFRDDETAAVSSASQKETELAPLFDEQRAADLRARWTIVQQGFVDDPRKAVADGDELVAQVIKSLAETFAKQRAALEGQSSSSSTEELRLALRRYRSFFERLLSI